MFNNTGPVTDQESSAVKMCNAICTGPDWACWECTKAVLQGKLGSHGDPIKRNKHDKTRLAYASVYIEHGMDFVTVGDNKNIRGLLSSCAKYTH